MDVNDLKGLFAEVNKRMNTATEHVRHELSGVRTGRASVTILDSVHVEAYGSRMPLNQLMMMKLLVNQTLFAQGLHATQLLGTVFDGIARHTVEGYAFQQRAATAGFRGAVRERDQPFGDAGRSTFKG